jgi:hypothetical protein
MKRHLMRYCHDSVYRNKLGAPFEAGKGYKREKFSLSQQSLKSVYNHLVGWSFVKKVDLA